MKLINPPDFDATLDAVVRVDQNGMITDWNAAAERIFGWPYTTVVGRSRFNLLVSPFDARICKALSLQVGDTVPTSNDLLLFTALRRNGEEFPAEMVVRALNVEGQIFFTAFIRDSSVSR